MTPPPTPPAAEASQPIGVFATNSHVPLSTDSQPIASQPVQDLSLTSNAPAISETELLSSSPSSSMPTSSAFISAPASPTPSSPIASQFTAPNQPSVTLAAETSLINQDASSLSSIATAHITQGLCTDASTNSSTVPESGASISTDSRPDSHETSQHTATSSFLGSHDSQTARQPEATASASDPSSGESIQQPFIFTGYSGSFAAWDFKGTKWDTAWRGHQMASRQAICRRNFARPVSQKPATSPGRIFTSQAWQSLTSTCHFDPQLLGQNGRTMEQSACSTDNSPAGRASKRRTPLQPRILEASQLGDLHTTPARNDLGTSNGNAEPPCAENGTSISSPRATQDSPLLVPSLSDQMRSLSFDSDTQTSRSTSKESSVPCDLVDHANASKAQQDTQGTQTQNPDDLADEDLGAQDVSPCLAAEALRGAESIAADLGDAVRKATDDITGSFPSCRICITPMQKEQPRRIALLGDSGQGKSSLINSLLNLPGIAHTSDTGAACTSVVTEYHQRYDWRRSPISIEVDLYAGAALKELVKGLAGDYRQLYLPDQTSAQDYADRRKRSDVAWSTLKAAFQHHQGFSAEFLQDNSDGATDRINQQLIDWAQDIEWPTVDFTDYSYNGSRRLFAWPSTTEYCCSMTRAFMEDSLWPFTKCIRVYLSAPILDSGVILVDLPGLHDTDLTKVKATQHYLSQCDKVLIVSKIARVIADPSVKSNLLKIAARHLPIHREGDQGKKVHLAVVCTEADRIDIQTAKAELCGDGRRIPQEELEQLEAKLHFAKASGDERQKKDAKRRLEFALIEARAAHVTDALQKWYSAEMNGDLNVFCVGNQAYEKFYRKGIAKFVQASGIPQLRQFCIKITGDGRLQYTRHVIRSILPSRLASAELWATSNMPRGAFSDADKSNILRHLNDIRSQVLEYTTQLRQAFNDSFEELIMSIWVRRQSEWNAAAIESAEQWEKWRWDSYASWCRRNGDHSTTAHQNVNWNTEIIWKMCIETALQWELLEDEIPTVFEKLAKDLRKALTEFKENAILQAPATPHRDMLISSADAAEGMWTCYANLEEQKLARGLNYIKKQATEANETSYIFAEMLSTYRAAAAHSIVLIWLPATSSSTAEEETGCGIFERQKAEISGRIRSETLFPNMATRLSTDVKALANRTEESLNMMVKQIMERLEYDVNLVLKEGELATGVENSVTRLMKAVDSLRDRLEELPKF